MASMIEYLNGMAGPWSAGMWAALWQSSILVGILVLAGGVLKRIPPAVRFWLWMFVGLRLVVMPFVTLELAVIPPAAAPGTATGNYLPMKAYAAVESLRSVAERTPSLEAESGGEAPAAPQPIRHAAIPIGSGTTSLAALDFRAALMILWGVGLLVVLGRLVWTCGKVHRILAAAAYRDRRLNALVARAGQYFGEGRARRVAVTRDAVAPFVYGVWRPTIVLPRHLVDQASDEQLLLVLTHEIAHVRRFDPLLGWVFALCHTLYFFHPLLPFVKRQLLLERERACDDFVLALHGARPSAYADTLVAVAAMCGSTRRMVPALLAGESFQDLAARLHGLRHSARRDTRMTPAGGLLLALCGILMAPGIALTQAGAVIPGRAGVPESPREKTAARVGADTAPPTVGEALQRIVAAANPPTHTESAPAAMRTLHFPANRVVGTLQMKDRNATRHIDAYWCWVDGVTWEYAGAATGEVRVPEGKDLWLTLNEEAFRDTRFLRKFGPDDIYRLSTLDTTVAPTSLEDRNMEDVGALTGLRDLKLRYSHVTDDGLKVLERLEHLEYLETPYTLSDAGMATIAKVSTLRGLYVNRNEVTDAGMVYLASLRNLEELTIGSGQITDAGLAHIEALPALHYVMIWGTSFGDEAMRHLAKVPNLVTLNASNQAITNRGVQYIANAPRLETLSLYGVDDITGLALQHLAKLRSLRMLGLSCPVGEKTKLNGSSMVFLTQCTNLEVLDAPREMDDAGLAHLATLPRLRVLRLWSGTRDTGITDTGLATIASIRTLREVQVLGESFTDTGLATLAALRDLESLDFQTHSEAITNGGVAALAPLTHLKHLALGFNKRSGVTLSAISALNTLSDLESIHVTGIRQDDSTLDLSPLHHLENASFSVDGGWRDEDLACFANLPRLRWLQGISGITDAGVAHLEGMTQLDRLNLAGELSDAALASLSGLSALDSLSISGDFTGAGLQSLYGLDNLHWLTVTSETPLGDGSVMRLINALPNLTMFNQQPLGAGTRGAGGFAG